jgi:zinc transporter
MTKALLKAFNIYPASKKIDQVSMEQIPDQIPENSYQWLHFNLNSPETASTIRGIEGLDEVLVDALLKEETRPRISFFNDDMLVILRGINLAEGADPEDMISARLLIAKNRIISCQRRNLLSFDDIIRLIEQGEAPKSTAHFLVFLCERVVFRMSDLMEEIEDRSVEMEELVLDNQGHDYKHDIHNLRLQVIQLKRFLIPQRDAFMKLQIEKTSWITAKQQLRFREITDQLIRYLEMLDAARDMATVSQETLDHRQNEQLNKRMYVLSIVTVLFLPLGFFTGLLGVNLAGIPKAENPLAFPAFFVLLLFIVGFQFWLLRRNKWL